MALVDRELLGDPEGPTRGQDGDLGHRVGVRGQQGDQGVPGLVDGHRVLLLGKEGVGGIPAAEDDPVPGLVDVLGEDDVPVVADGHDGRLVDQVGQVRPREPRRGPGHGVEVDVGCQVLARDVHGQDGGPLGLVGQRDLHLPVEAARPEEGGVEHLGRLVAAMTTTPVLGSKPSISASSWLRVCSRSSLEHEGTPTALADGVDLVDEDDGGGPLAGVGEQVPDPGGPTPTNSSTKLEPVRARNGTSASPATARAIRVLPVPGGPTMSTPRGPMAPARA